MIWGYHYFRKPPYLLSFALLLRFFVVLGGFEKDSASGGFFGGSWIMTSLFLGKSWNLKPTSTQILNWSLGKFSDPGIRLIFYRIKYGWNIPVSLTIKKWNVACSFVVRFSSFIFSAVFCEYVEFSPHQFCVLVRKSLPARGHASKRRCEFFST